MPYHVVAGRIYDIAVRPLELLIIAAIAASVPIAWADHANWLRLRGFDRPVAVLIVLAVVELALTPRLGEGGRVFRQVVLEPGLFYLVISRLFDDSRRRRWVGIALVCGGAIASIHGLSQFWFQSQLIEAEGVWRVRGPYPSPNNMALYLDRAVPLALGLALAGRQVWFATGAVLGALALAATYSLGGWVAGLAAVTFVASFRSWRFALGIPIAGAALVVSAAIALRPERLMSHISGLETSTSGLRLLLWQSSIAMALDHPWFGVGLDNFLYFYDPARTDRPYMLLAAWRESSLSHPHNLFLDWWLSLGLGGLLLLAWILVLFGRYGITSVRRAGDERWLAIGVVGAIVATILHGSIDNGYFLPDLAILWWTLAAILAGIAEAGLTSGRGRPFDDRQTGGAGDDGR